MERTDVFWEKMGDAPHGMFVSPNSSVEVPTPSVKALGNGAFGGDSGRSVEPSGVVAPVTGTWSFSRPPRRVQRWWEGLRTGAWGRGQKPPGAPTGLCVFLLVVTLL